MPKLAPAKIKRAISFIATVALVVQIILPGGLFKFGLSPARADDTNWHFTSASDYTISGDYATVLDTYAILDLYFTASGDNLDSYGPTTDLTEADTDGRILAAVDTVDAFPYSIDYGNSWSAPGLVPLNITHTKLTKVTSGPNSGRIIATGDQTGTGAIVQYTTGEGDAWQAVSTISATATQSRAIKFIRPALTLAGTGPGAGNEDGFIFYNLREGDVGSAWTKSAIPLEVDASSVNDFEVSSTNFLAALTLDSSVSNKVAILYSTDGINWTQAGSVDDSFTNDSVLDMAVASDAVYATTNTDYILKSTDNGVTFSRISATGVSGAKVIYVTANGEPIVIKNAYVFRSPDGGTDFAAQTNGVTNGPSSADALIRMSNDSFLLAVTDSGGTTGDAYLGGFPGSFIYIGGISVKNNTGTGQAYTEITDFSDSYAATSEGTNIKYQISNNGTSWYYWDGSNWTPTGGSAANSNTVATIHDKISFFHTDIGTGTFYFRGYLDSATTLTYSDSEDNSVALDYVSITYANNTGGGNESSTDKEPPTSKVVGILGADGQLISPMPKNIYQPQFFIAATANDNVAIKQVELWGRQGKTGGFDYYGRGVKDQPLAGYYWWSFDTTKLPAKGDGTYYFYSLATDTADNIEVIPKRPPNQQYDAKTTVNTKKPYIEYTSPYHTETKVGTMASLTVRFSQAMNKPSVQKAFSLASQGGGGSINNIDLQWSFTWQNSRTVVINHQQPFTYNTLYIAFINPDIAEDTNWLHLDTSKGVPNPWQFTTEPPQKPDLSNSGKEVWIYDENTSLPPEDEVPHPGDYLYYTVTIKNSDSTVADNTTLLDAIPAHTRYIEGSLHVSYFSPLPGSFFTAEYIESDDSIPGNGKISGQGTVVMGQPVYVNFMVKIDKPLANGTVITNIAEISDNVNPTHYKPVSVTVKSASNWAHSYKGADKTIAKVGDTLTYKIYLENSGDMDALETEVVDKVPAYTSIIIGSPTGGLVYDPITNSLTWSGSMAVGQNRTFTFQVHIDSQPPLGTITNTATITDELGQYVLVKEVTIVPDDSTPPYIVPPTQPKGGETSVKLFSPIVITFSDSIDTKSLRYTVSRDTVFGPGIVYDNSKDKSWKETWSHNSDGKINAKVTIQPDKPFQSGSFYTIQVTDAIGGNGKHLGRNGDVPNNTWSFTTVRPALYFTDNSILSFVAGTVSEAITVKLGDWINYDDPAATTKQFRDYAAENPEGISVKLLATSATGRFDTDPKGKFDGSVISVLMSQGKDSITFYYTDSVVTSPTLYKILVYAPSAGYLVYGDERWVLTTTSDEQLTSDQIYFRTGKQSVPAGDLSQPIEFEIRNPKGELVPIEGGRSFLLETTSLTGEFYNQFQWLLNQYVITLENGEDKVYYELINPSNNRPNKMSFYYLDNEPGTYLMGVNDKSLVVAAGSGPAQRGTQAITILPIEDQELEELLEELEEVKDETDRELSYVEINPTEATVLPSGVKTFKAEGFDTEGKEIPELKFSWYMIGGGGTILKKGLSNNNHASAFTAGKIPGVYADTVLVATLYNGKIEAALASVTVADVVSYGGPGELPSTGPNGIQLLFIVLTLLSAVALAAVEHYEKTHFSEGAQQAR